MRIAAIRYINTLPLVFGLRNQPNVELTVDTPAACYKKLIHDEVDVALVPVIATQTHPGLHAMKGLGIAAKRRTESVFLFSTKPLDRVQTVLADRASLTSVMLARIILHEKYGNDPEFLEGTTENIHDVLRLFDAAVVIGDEAILTDKSDYDHYDLATEWYSITGFPFVFALWASKKRLSLEERELFQKAYEQANSNWETVYEEALRMLAVERSFLTRYYNENLHYQLTRSDYEGLLRFLTLASDFGYLEKVRKDIWM